jgi:hypothetical protein
LPGGESEVFVAPGTILIWTYASFWFGYAHGLRNEIKGKE